MAAAADSSSGVGDDAVAAELVAAVLYLDKSPGMASQTIQMKALILVGMGNIQHIHPVFLIFFCQTGIQNICQLCFSVVSNDQIHTGILFKLL